MPGHRHRREGPPDGGIAHLGHARGRLLTVREDRIQLETSEPRIARVSPILGHIVELNLADTPAETPEPQESGGADPDYDDGSTIHRGLE